MARVVAAVVAGVVAAAVMARVVAAAVMAGVVAAAVMARVVATAVMAGIVTRGRRGDGAGRRGGDRGSRGGGARRGRRADRDEDELLEPPLRDLSLRTTWIVRRIVLVWTSGVAVATGWTEAAAGLGGEDGRAIAAAATPPRAERTATEATSGVRRFMPHTIDSGHPSTRQAQGKLWQSLNHLDGVRPR